MVVYSRLNVAMDPDPGKNDTNPDPDPGKTGFSTRKIVKFALCVLLKCDFSINNHANYVGMYKIKISVLSWDLFSVFNGF